MRGVLLVWCGVLYTNLLTVKDLYHPRSGKTLYLYSYMSPLSTRAGTPLAVYSSLYFLLLDGTKAHTGDETTDMPLRASCSCNAFSTYLCATQEEQGRRAIRFAV